MKLIIILLFFPFLTIAQTTIGGKIINSTNKDAIGFATVGLMKENIGINALEDGSFQLSSIKAKPNDTLIFSCVGFATLKIPFDNYKNGSIIVLSEQQTMLDEVIITNKNSWTFKTLNDFSNCGNSFVASSGYQTQLAQHFEVPEDYSLLKDIRICRFSLPLIAPEKAVFRIRIYDIDTVAKSPSYDLCNQIIEVKTRSKTVDINLEKYNIRIPHKGFFVAIEWLKIPFNESKSQMKVNGKNIEHITYRPSIGWTNNVNTKMEAWMLDYKNIWRPMFTMNNRTNVSISATVKY